MPPLRIGFDMDGVLADFARAFREVEEGLYGPGVPMSEGQPETEEEAQEQAPPVPQGETAAPSARAEGATGNGNGSGPTPHQMRRRRDAVWREIQATPNFWESLKPSDPDAVRRIHELMLRYQWEVFFITQRPKSEGDTVQRQTQRWLVAQGFDLPSVLVLGGSRGAAAGALRLDYHVDDSAQNCIDVISESRARPILIVPDSDETTVNSARKLGIGTAPTIGECLDILEQASTGRTEPGLLARLASMVGWR